METGCQGTGGLELPSPNPGSKRTPKACRTRNIQSQPKRPSHRARSSVEIIITVITNNNNNTNNNKVVKINRRGGWEKTLKHPKN